MHCFDDYLQAVADPQHRSRVEEILSWVATTFSSLEPKIAWNQPMFTHHDTFIIGFSTAKAHLAVAPEATAITHFATAITEAGYQHTSNLFKIKWGESANFTLLKKIIEFNMLDKKECKTFWRK